MLLAEVKPLLDQPPERRVPQLQAMLHAPEDGRCKLFLICVGLALRSRRSALFEAGDYLPIVAQGLRAHQVVAFARRDETDGIIVVAPRLFATLCDQPGALPLGMQVWGDTALPISWLAPTTELRDIVTGRAIAFELDSEGIRIPLGELISAYPVALLEYALPSVEQ